MNINPVNKMLYTDLPIDELDERLSMEELEIKLELDCWILCSKLSPAPCWFQCALDGVPGPNG